MNNVKRSDLSIKFDKCWVDDCSDDLVDDEGEGVREGRCLGDEVANSLLLLPLLGVVSMLSMTLLLLVDDDISSVDSLLSSGQLLQLSMLTSDVRLRIILERDFLCNGCEYIIQS